MHLCLSLDLKIAKSSIALFEMYTITFTLAAVRVIEMARGHTHTHTRSLTHNTVSTIINKNKIGTFVDFMA